MRVNSIVLSFFSVRGKSTKTNVKTISDFALFCAKKRFFEINMQKNETKNGILRYKETR